MGLLACRFKNPRLRRGLALFRSLRELIRPRRGGTTLAQDLIREPMRSTPMQRGNAAAEILVSHVLKSYASH
jgi:hypothetical protein